jgi:hypothetical protein
MSDKPPRKRRRAELRRHGIPDTEKTDVVIVYVDKMILKIPANHLTPFELSELKKSDGTSIECNRQQWADKVSSVEAEWNSERKEDEKKDEHRLECKAKSP